MPKPSDPTKIHGDIRGFFAALFIAFTTFAVMLALGGATINWPWN